MPQERRLATVLFADIVGSTDLTGSHDPEVVRHRLAAAFAAMREVLTQHGGTVEKFIGDAVMAIFGVPAAHDDDAVRAVRAALALRGAVTRVEDGGDLRLRIGINSGEVVAGDEEHAGTLVTGTPVIVASRLQSAAAADEILVGTLTRRLTEDRFEYGPAHPVLAKNLGEVEASAVLGPAAPRSTRRSAFIGRAAELARLRAARDAVARSGRSGRITVIGAPGIGKTRIAEQLDDEPTVWGHCASYAQGDALAPLQEIVRARIGTSEAPSEILGALLSGRPWSREISPEDTRRELGGAIAALIDARGDATTAIVVEDVHDAEPELLQILDEVCARSRSTLIVALARPEVRDRHAAWIDRGDTLELGPLEAAETEMLARSLLRDRASDELLSTILTRTGGIPLYVEQVVRTILEGGDPGAIPATLRGLIAARLDRAGTTVRLFLQRGSALGREFWLDAIPWDEAGTTLEQLAEAQARGLVEVLDPVGPSSEPTIRFTHALIREVVYASTTKSERIELHEHYGRWFTSIGADRGIEVADPVAFHAEQAFRSAREIEHPRARDLGRAAFAALMRATREARRRADFRAALGLSARAMDAGRDADVPRPLQVEALGTHATIRLRLEPGTEAIALLDRAIASARDADLAEELVRLLTWRVGIALADDLPLARRLVREGVTVARATGDDELIAYAVSRSGVIGEATGDLDDQARALGEARDRALASGARSWLADTLAELSGNALQQGRTDDARRLADEALRAAGTPLQRFKASVATAWSLLAENDVAAARGDADAAAALARDIGGPWAFALASELIGETLLRQGDARGARAILRDAVAKLDPDATPAMRAHVARVRAALARAALRLGELDEALAAALSAVTAAPATDVRAAAVALWALAEVDAAAGDDAAARERYARALDTIEPTGYRMLAARIRSAYAAYLAEHEVVPRS